MIDYAREESAAEEVEMEIAVITGTSTGIGFAAALHLARHGYRVFAAMRNLGKAQPLRAAAAEAKLPLEVIELDVTSDASVQRAFETVAGLPDLLEAVRAVVIGIERNPVNRT